MKLFEYIKNLFKKFVLRIIKRKQMSVVNVILSKDIEDKFNSKQKKVLAECLQLGLDITRIAKKRYSAEQMLVLMYGLLLKLDITPFESFVLTPCEMELQMWQEAIKKYLGNNYLITLLNKTNGTMLDDYVKTKINHDLKESLEVAFEMAPTLLEERTEEDDFYDILVQMCKDRDMDYTRITRASVPMMIYDYEKLEKDLAKVLDRRCIMLKKLSNYKLEPTLLSIIKNKDIEDRVAPVSFYMRNKHVADYYRVYDGIHVFLCRKGFATIKIR